MQRTPEESWREALWIAREQLREMERDHWPEKIIYRQRSTVERIKARGLPEWQERKQFAGFSYPRAKGE